MKEKKFKIGDRVTYKSCVGLISQDGYIDSYYHGGENYDGHTGTVMDYGEFHTERGCYQMLVSIPTHPNVTYSMLESEFVEYNQKTTNYIYDGFGMKHKFI